MTDISGRTYFPLFKPDDQLSAFSKTFMATSLWARPRYLTWKVRATPQGCSLFQFVPSTPRIDETDSGLSEGMWLTPTATNITERSREPDETQRDEKQVRQKHRSPETWLNK